MTTGPLSPKFHDEWGNLLPADVHSGEVNDELGSLDLQDGTRL